MFAVSLATLSFQPNPVVLATFDKATTSHTWQVMNDPVMGGQSHSTFAQEGGKLPAAFAWQLDVPEVRSVGGKIACASLFLSGLVVGGLSTATTIVGLVGPSADNATAPASCHRIL